MGQHTVLIKQHIMAKNQSQMFFFAKRNMVKTQTTHTMQSQKFLNFKKKIEIIMCMPTCMYV